MKFLVRGDLDGFCALALDNLINLLIISGFCLGLLKFSPELFYGRMLPAVAVSLLVGNLFQEPVRKRGRTLLSPAHQPAWILPQARDKYPALHGFGIRRTR